MKQIILLSLLFSITISAAFAQGYDVKGKILDPNKEPLIGVGITLFKGLDSTGSHTAITDLDGNFTIPGVLPGTYNLIAVYMGYEPYNRTFTISNAEADLGTFSLKSSTNVLQNVTITAEQVRAQQLGDTSQFNASSYKTNPDASAEDLINKMPGITTQGGNVKVNGEDVKQVLVDGKAFFGDDPNAALKNLPAEIIEKIQVFDKQSDQSQFTGFDDGSSQKTINIITKRGRNNGMFGKVSAGLGQDVAAKDSRYTGGGNINFFNGDRRISIVAMANNVNQQNFSSEDLLGVSSSSSGRGGNRGGGRSGGGGPGGGGPGGGGDAASNFLVGQQGGITQTQSIGINYSDSWGPKVKLTGSYFFNRAENTNQTRLTRSFIVNDPDSALIYRETGTSHSIDYNHRANLRVEWTIDSANSIVLNPKISYQNNLTDRDLVGTTTLGQSTEQGHIANKYHAENNGYNLSNQFLFRHRFAKQGRTISLGFNTTLNDKEGTGSLYSLNEYFGSDTSLNDQRYDLTTDGLTLSGNLNYTEPISRRVQIMVTYNPSYNKNHSDKNTYNVGSGEYTDLDTGLTNRYENRYYYHRGGIGYRYSDSQFNINATLNAQYATLTGDQAFPFPAALNRDFSDLLPSAMLNYRFSRTENIRIMYRTNTNAPSISQLQDIVDNSNPLLLRTGNPDLRQDYTHSLSLRYGNTKSKNGSGIFFFANASYINNYVGNSTIIALKDTTVYQDVLLKGGSQLSRPANLDGAWNARSFLTYSIPVKSLKSNVNLNAGLTYNRTPGIINGLTNFAGNYAYNGGIVIGSNISENLDFTLSYNGAYSVVKNTLQAQTDYNYYSQTTALRFNWIFLKDFVFNTNLNHTLYSGLGTGYDQNFILWNASLGYKFLKDRSLQADIYAFDILKQNNSISRNITDSYIEDTETQVLQQYFMLRLTYTIRKFKGAIPGTEESGENGGRERRREGGPGTRGNRGERPE